MMEMVLIDKDLWDIVSEEIVRPGTDVTPAQKSEWKRRTAKARAAIIQSISSSELVHINNLTDPVEIWNKLNKIYKSKSSTSKYFLL